MEEVRSGRIAVVGMGIVAFAAAIACGSFSSNPPVEPPSADSGADVATSDAATEIDAAPDVADAAAREAGPLWDGGCVEAVVGGTVLCDAFEDTALGARFDAVVSSPANSIVKVDADPSYEPTLTSSNKVLFAGLYNSIGLQYAYVAKNVPFGWRFGLALRFAVHDHPSGGVPGPRLTSGEGAEGTVPLFGLFLSNRIGLQQVAPGVKEVKDLGALKRNYWHKLVIEVRREPSPTGLGFIYTTLDGAEAVKTPLQTTFASGQLRLGVPYAVGIPSGTYYDDVAFFSEP